MSFSSLGFFVLLLGCAAVYYAVPARRQPAVLLAASLVFYACSSVGYLALLAAAVVFAWAMARAVARAGAGTGGRKGLLAAALVVLAANLCFFKYYDWFGRQLAQFAFRNDWPFIPPDYGLAAPLGVSFYTFALMGYLIDVYRGKISPVSTPWNLGLFAAFFPLVSSGPIERAGRLLPQLKAPHAFDYEGFCQGASRMLWGFFKKFVVADTIGITVGRVYGAPADFTGPYLALATLLYAYQLYSDFSGYSDIAIGAARIFGVQAAENFSRPFWAGSYQGLWNRWHNSLTGWFREYLYFPLGGSRKGAARTYLNILIIFLVSGIWHGSTVNFAVWGLLNGVYMALARARGKWRPLPQKRGTVRYLWGIVCCFVLFASAIVFFRAETLADALTVYTRLTAGWGQALADPAGVVATLKGLNIGRVTGLLILGGTAACEWVEWRAARAGVATGAWMRSLRAPVRLALYYALALAVMMYGQMGQSAFIYFQF